MHGATVKKDTQCTCNLTLWRVLATPVGRNEQQCVVRITELHVTVNSIKILSFSRQFFYGALVPPAVVTGTSVAM